jgi:hypothetical protein
LALLATAQDCDDGDFLADERLEQFHAEILIRLDLAEQGLSGAS